MKPPDNLTTLQKVFWLMEHQKEILNAQNEDKKRFDRKAQN